MTAPPDPPKTPSTEALFRFRVLSEVLARVRRGSRGRRPSPASRPCLIWLKTGS